MYFTTRFFFVLMQRFVSPMHLIDEKRNHVNG